MNSTIMGFDKQLVIQTVLHLLNIIIILILLGLSMYVLVLIIRSLCRIVKALDKYLKLNEKDIKK